MPPKGFRKQKQKKEEDKKENEVKAEVPPPPAIVQEEPKLQCKTCEAWVGGNDWGKCKYYPNPVDKFATDWCLRHHAKGKYSVNL